MTMINENNAIITVIVEELKAILFSLIGGARYGLKIRLPHALITTLIFRNDLTPTSKLRSIFKLAVEHASNLAAFATIYKCILAILKWTHRHYMHYLHDDRTKNEDYFKFLGRSFISMMVDGPFPGESRLLRAAHLTPPPGHPEFSHHAFVAGAIGGYMIWGRYSSVNNQVVMYLTSRVIVALWKRHCNNNNNNTLLPKVIRNRIYSIASAIVWGIVMLLFEENPDVLHPSLKSSMDEIYRYQHSFGSVDSAESNPQDSLSK